MTRRRFEAAAFLASFLAFELELIVAKSLLPLFGGSAFVWTISMMFFQGLLLAGYLYAEHALKHSYGRAHALLLLAPLIFFPLAPAPPSGAAIPPLALLWSLLRCAAVPFLALSTTSLVISDWLVRSDLPERSDPYFIYGASNAGALAGLLSYPLIIEPSLSIKSQSLFWCALYVLCAALVLFCLPKKPGAPPKEDAGVSWREGLVWTALSAASAAAMLACSNAFSYNLAAAPLLWVAPLSLYLGTYYLTFKRKPWLASGKGLGLCLAAVLLLMAAPTLIFAAAGKHMSAKALTFLREFTVLSRLALDAAALFSLCMLCHISLALSRPEPARAPRFYVFIALGGWLGSVLVAVLVPLLARHVATLALDWGLAVALALLGLCLRHWDKVKERRRPALGLAAAAALGAACLAWRAPPRKTVYALRNFYGIYEVRDMAELRKFFHGNTVHGMQYMDRYLRAYPMSYYHPHSPLGQLYDELGGSFKTIGAVGLGVGSIAAYGKPGQTIDFYELDGDVEHIASEYFTFLKDSKAKVNVILGDARLSLTKKQASYDLLVLDAFTSDAIPLHLMTKEAFELYLTRLAPGGVIACHVSNRMLNLKPVLANLASALGLYGAFNASNPDGMRKDEEIPSDWVALSRQKEPVARLQKERGWKDIQAFARKDRRPWTDQYASILGAISL